jgi:hypothetical protein
MAHAHDMIRAQARREILGLFIKTGDRQMDARYAMADAYKALRRAGMEATEFEAEINNCTDSTDAYRIALKWQAIASKKVVA